VMNTGNLGRLALAGLALCMAVSSGSIDAAANGKGKAANPMDRHQPLLQSLVAKASAEQPRVTLADDGYITFLGAPAGNAFASGAKSADPAVAAEAFINRWRGNFMSTSASLTVSVSRVKPGADRTSVRFSQQYAGLPVHGAEIVIQVSADGAIEMATFDVMRGSKPMDNGSLALAPVLSEGDAVAAGVELVSAEYPGLDLENTAPELVLYDPTIVGEKGAVALAWLFELASLEPGGAKERVFVDAHTGKVLLHYSLIHHAKNRQIFDSNNTSADPGTLARSEGGAASGIADVNFAYDYFGDTYDFYLSEHGRDSIDGAGSTLSATVRYCDPFDVCPYPNAFWDGARMYFGAGFSAADDVVSHELTHGVTENESNLQYLNQSGAINESFSDMWGEWIDLSNSGGTDTPEVRWLLGEDVPVFGTIRDMEHPPAFGNPDRMGSGLFYTGSGDNGGVHINSGVGNKLCFLLTDGGSFNGRTVTAMGIADTADLFYECQTNLLTSTSTYAGLYNAVTQAAINLGFTQPERDNIEQACLAVEIKPLPAGVTGFTATSTSANTDISLAWTNPVGGGFQQVVVRRSTTSFPTDAASGTLVYQGTNTSVVDPGLVQDTTYYYSIFAYYGGISYSYPAYRAAVAGQDMGGYFTEQFVGDNDMDNLTITLTPDGGENFYRLCGEAANAFPTNPATGTPIFLGDDGSSLVNLTGGAKVLLYGTQYGSFYVNANGNITFLASSGTFDETLDDHFDVPRISALFDDLNPAQAGVIRFQQFANRMVVTYEGIPEYDTGNSNNFQVEMFFDGAIHITYLAIAATDGIAGVSEGLGLPLDFAESNLGSWDNDGDLLPNCWEVDYGLNPNSAVGNDGASGDPDSDGLSNTQEFTNGVDPLDDDTDGDGLEDGPEVLSHGTNPLLADSDGDGFTDGHEISAGTNALNASNYPTTLLWNDFAYAGTETGAFTLPYNTVAEAVNRVSVGGTIRIKGDSTDTSSPEVIRIIKQLKIESIGGSAKIGQ